MHESVGTLHHRTRRGHFFTHLLRDRVGILRAAGVDEPLHLVALQFFVGREERRIKRVGSDFAIARIVCNASATEEPIEDAREQRIRTESIRAVILVVRLTEGVETFDVGHHRVGRTVDHALAIRLGAIGGPQAAHRIMDAWEDLHRKFCRIVTDELTVDLDDAAELALQVFATKVRKVEEHHVSAANAKAVLHANLEDLTCRDIARHDVSILWVALFEEVVPLGIGDLSWVARVALLARNPHAPALATRRFAHEAKFV